MLPQPVRAQSGDEILKYIPTIEADVFNPDAKANPEANPKRGGSFRVRIPADSSSLNPLTYQSQADAMALQLLNDSLIGLNHQTQEKIPRIAWTYAKGDLLKLKDQPTLEGTFLKMGVESDLQSTFEFVPNAFRHFFYKGNVESVDLATGTLTLKPEYGGKTYTGEVIESPSMYVVNEAYAADKLEHKITGSLSELDSWRDRIANEDLDRPFQKQECYFTFTLRDGVTWHDGKPLSVQDVLFSFETMQNPDVEAQRLRNYYNDITDALVLEDGKTIKFLSRKPYFQQFDFLGSLNLIPKHVFNPEQFGGDTKSFADAFNTHPFRQQPILCGPYQLEEWKKDDFLKVKRFPGYWASKLPEGSVFDWNPMMPYFDDITLVLISEKSVSIKELERGNIHADMDIEPDTWSLGQTQSPEFTSKFVRAKKLGFLFTLISLKNDHPILKDVAVRKALAHLIPRERIIKDIYYDLAIPVTGPFFLEGPGYNKDVPQIPYDPNEAKKLLRRNGWLDKDRDGIIEKEIDGKIVPLELEYMIHTAREYHTKVADILKESVEQVGIKLTIRKLDFNTMIDKTTDRDFEMVRNAWGTAIDPDPYQIWHSTQIGNKGSNYAGFRNDKADELMVRLREEFDATKRWELARQIHQIIADQQSVIFLEGFNETYFYHRGIRGVKFYPSQYPYNFVEWWWDKKPEEFTATISQ